MSRSSKVQRQFTRYMESQPAGCVFCRLPAQHRIVVEKEHLFIIENKFPYVVWDQRRVAEHLLLVPKEHAEALHDLSAPARTEVWMTLTEYEADGYNLWARSVGNRRKTVAHQHTHLIKNTGRPVYAHFFNKQPYMNWFK